MCVLVVVEVVVEGAGLAQTGFLPVVTMVSSGFAFRRWKEGGSERGEDQEVEDGGVNTRERGIIAVNRDE